MRYIARIGARTVAIDIAEHGAEHRVTLDGQAIAVRWKTVGTTADMAAVGATERHYSLLAGLRSHDIYIRPIADDDEGGPALAFEVTIGGLPYHVRVQDERVSALATLVGGAHAAGSTTLRAPMPGMVSHVLVEEGARVTRGQTIVVLEAMKMENDLPTPRAGIVMSLRAHAGQTVNQNDILAIIGEDAAGAPSGDEEESAI